MTCATPPKPALDLDEVNSRFAEAKPAEVIRWASQTFGAGLVMSSSFGAQAAVMMHHVIQVVPKIPVILIDTGYLFPETYRFIEQLRDRLALNLKVYQSQLSPARQEALHGRLWEQGEEGLTRYNQSRKVEPMQRALRQLDATAWLAGLRRQQTDHRATLRSVERQDGRYKVHPILWWTNQDVHAYLKANDLPYHPLFDQGYVSIGDTHTTRPVTADMHERAGRFGGLKQECGLHLPTTAEENESLGSSGL